jgi:hypothetical protein
MATAQVNGSSLTTTPYGTFTQARNNRGTIRANGTVSSNVVTSVDTFRPVVTTFASTVIENSVTEKDYAGKAVSGGVFAHNHVKPISSLVTTELAGLDNNAIKTPGNDGDTIRSINKFESNTDYLLTTAFRSNKYNQVTGLWDAGYPSGVTIAFSGDNAATPSAAVPGELTYRTGARNPVNDDYAPKTNY